MLFSDKIVLKQNCAIELWSKLADIRHCPVPLEVRQSVLWFPTCGNAPVAPFFFLLEEWLKYNTHIIKFRAIEKIFTRCCVALKISFRRSTDWNTELYLYFCIVERTKAENYDTKMETKTTIFTLTSSIRFHLLKQGV
jgi:hypothetical protein